MATGRVPTTANSPLTAKGDLFTYSTAPARLAVGPDGSSIVADSSTSTGLRYQATNAAGKNIVINGGFDFFQRGSFSTTGGGFGLDRWQTVASGSASATVLTQQTTGVPNGSRYCMRIAMGASGGYGNQFHIIETANVAQLWGQTATFSVKIRRNATLAGSISIAVEKSATVDASMGATWSTLASTTATNANLPTGTGSANWLTISFQVTIPNDGTANSIRIQFGQSQVEASGAYWEIAQVQLEVGSVATAFSRAGGTIQGELAACQRYYFRASFTSTSRFGVGFANTTTSGNLTNQFPVEMRTAPTALEQNGVATDYTVSIAGANVTSSAVPTIGVVNQYGALTTLTFASGLTAGAGLLLRPLTGAYLGWSAEL